MKKISNAAGRWICVILVLVMTAITCVEPVKAVTGYSSTAWVDNLDFVDIRGSEKPIQCIYTMEKDGSFLASSYGFRNEGVKTGETIYIRDWTYTCNGYTYFAVIYKGRLMYLNKKYINVSNLVSVNQPKYPGRKNKVKMKAVAGNISDQNNWFYIYSQADDSQPVNCYGIVPVGETLEITKKDYNSEWTQIKWNGRICYIRKSNISFDEAYLAGARRECQTNIMLSQNANLTYKGILKNYNKKLTRKEFYKLAAKWCKAAGKAQFKAGKKVKNKELSASQYNTLLQKMIRKTQAGNVAYNAAKVDADGDGITRDVAISQLYRAYQVTRDKDYLTTGLEFSICTADDQNLCLDLWDTQGESVFLSDRSGQTDQSFYLSCNNGFWRLRGCRKNYTVCSSTKDVYQDFAGYDSQKLTFEYNDDGTVCIKNIDGLYLDLIDGAVKNSHLKFAPKSDSSTQKFIIKYNE